MFLSISYSPCTAEEENEVVINHIFHSNQRTIEKLFSFYFPFLVVRVYKWYISLPPSLSSSSMWVTITLHWMVFPSVHNIEAEYSFKTPVTNSTFQLIIVACWDFLDLLSGIHPVLEGWFKESLRHWDWNRTILEWFKIRFIWVDF